MSGEDVDLVSHLPTIGELYYIYNQKYFDNKLMATLEWSNRMTQCAGICYLKNGRITIRLSRPLLQYRPFSDTINTLLHEMIHAHQFQSTNRLDRDGHGPAFISHASRINSLEGSNITVYHNFLEETRYLKKYIWRCDGPCRMREPFWGWVKRSINRKPQPADRWWSTHQNTCGGAFHRVDRSEIITSNVGYDRNRLGKNPTKISKFKGVGRILSSDFDGMRECKICLELISADLEKYSEHVKQCPGSLKNPKRDNAKLIIDLT